MKWYELRIDPQIGFRMIYDTKDDYKDGKNATASLRVKLLYRIYGGERAMSILNKDEPERSIEIHKLTAKYTLENTPVYLEFVGLPPGITRTHDTHTGKITNIKQNSHLDKQRSSLLTVRSVAGENTQNSYFSSTKE